MEPKDELKEIFQFAIYKLDNNLCTPAEIDTFADAAKTVLNLEGEIKVFPFFVPLPLYCTEMQSVSERRISGSGIPTITNPHLLLHLVSVDFAFISISHKLPQASEMLKGTSIGARHRSLKIEGLSSVHLL